MNIEQIKKQAQNENTPPEVLTQLAHSKSKIIRQYVASNSNTPVEILEKLSQEFPSEVMANPILELLILENYNQLLNIKREIAYSTNAPEKILELLKSDRDIDVRVAVASNVYLPETILNDLKNDNEKAVREAVAKNCRTPKHILDDLSNDEYMYVREAVAKNINTSDSTLKKMANSSTEYHFIRQKVSNTQKKKQIEQIREQAQGENTSSEILTKLATNRDRLTRQYVAGNPNTPVEILSKLSKEFPEEITANPIFN